MKRFTREELETAKQLAADLLAAGCSLEDCGTYFERSAVTIRRWTDASFAEILRAHNTKNHAKQREQREIVKAEKLKIEAMELQKFLVENSSDHVLNLNITNNRRTRDV